jgi:hypothetical protein
MTYVVSEARSLYTWKWKTLGGVRHSLCREACARPFPSQVAHVGCTLHIRALSEWLSDAHISQLHITQAQAASMSTTSSTSFHSPGRRQDVSHLFDSSLRKLRLLEAQHPAQVHSPAWEGRTQTSKSEGGLCLEPHTSQSLGDALGLQKPLLCPEPGTNLSVHFSVCPCVP